MIKIKDLLQYRSICMAVAILWVIFMHAGLSVGNGVVFFIKQIGYGGVDIFVFASGIGCFFSYLKNEDFFAFIKRRFYKLAPLYWIILIPWVVLKVQTVGMTFRQIVGNVLFIQAFTLNGCEFSWYISAMWLYYFLVPFFFAIITKTKKKYSVILIAIALLLAPTSYWNVSNLLIMIIRIPLFFMGMYVGKLASEDKKIGKIHGALLIFASVVGIIILRYCVLNHATLLSTYGLWWYPFILITPGLCFVITCMCYFIDKIKVGKIILKGMAYIGNHTYELFLMHILIFAIFGHYVFHGFIEGSNRNWILIILITLIAGLLFSRLKNGIEHILELIKLKKDNVNSQ